MVSSLCLYKRLVSFTSAKVEDKIEIKLGDGIKNINDKVDTIVIYGLGGETIIDIIKEDIERLKNIKLVTKEMIIEFSKKTSA